MSSTRRQHQPLPPAAREILEQIATRLRKARELAEAAAASSAKIVDRCAYALGTMDGIANWVADDLDRLLAADSAQLAELRASMTPPKKGRAQ